MLSWHLEIWSSCRLGPNEYVSCLRTKAKSLLQEVVFNKERSMDKSDAQKVNNSAIRRYMVSVLKLTKRKPDRAVTWFRFSRIRRHSRLNSFLCEL
jgi:hypothetical protein